MHSRIILFFVALLVANTHASTSDCTPSQIHLSFGDSYYLASAPNNSELNSSQVNNNQVYLVWQSQSECQYFVTVNDTQSQNQISSKPYVLTQTIDNQTSTISLFSYTILLNNLSYGTSYSYAILDQSNVSLAGPFQFNLASPNITGTSNKIIVAGNLGSQQNDTTTLEAINKLLENETYAGIIEIGEVPAYLQNGTYAIQSNFTLPNFTATLPLFMAPGQGDMADNLTYFNFRIRNPLFDATQNQYFSFNLQGIHFVSINLDYYNLNTTSQSQVYSWLQNDLNTANSTTARESWPFVVVITSYPIYCTNDPESASQTTDCLSYFGLNDQLNDLFTNSNVDLVISGGLNAYQQLLSTDHGSSSKGSKNNTIINPNSTIYIIEGVGTSSQSEIRPGFGVIYPQNISGNLSLIYEHYDSDTGDIASSITLVKTSTQESTPGDNTSNPNDSSQNSGDNTSNPANSTNTTDSTSNPSDNSQNSTDTVNTNTTNNSQNSTTTISDDGLIGPTENPDASDPEEPESIVPRLIIPFIIILVIILVAIYWKRRKQDPEMESLTVEEYKSNKIYNKRSTNASISMVDLVL